MIEIKHRFSSEVLRTVDADTLNGADLSGADLKYADLSRADLRGADLYGADLSGADLSGADLKYAGLRGADLRTADLREANLCGADIYGANLYGANLKDADLRDANLCGADLKYANLRDATLNGANLCGADLSGCGGLPTAASWVKHCEHDAVGIIVYKAIGNTDYATPARWAFEPGSFLTEVVNTCRTVPCGSGVSVANNMTWCRQNYPDAVIWRCHIDWIDLADLVVPYNTDGKARAGRVQLLEEMHE
jgi:uncharacterized protein YjbI with pentapeptide repeats